MDMTTRLKRLKFRAWHRGTRESDYTMGCFFDRFSGQWREEEVAWFEALLDEDDADVMAWALGTLPVPERYQGALMDAMLRLDYVEIPG
ncbi:MAG: succinate dehydrogenase assembly factor 2 [Novosphingobium sp.]